MKQTTKRATHWLGLALAVAVFAGGFVPLGRSQQKAKSASKAASPKQSRQQSPSKTTQAQTPTAAQALHPGDEFRVRTLPPEPPGKIAFASDRAGNFDIYVMDPDGGGIVRLTDNPAEDTSPTWSPDGTQIAFVSNRDSNKEIYVVSASGGSATRLTNNTFEDISPTWSPSLTNQRIAFVSNRDGNDEVYLMNADGTNQTNFTQNGADDNAPAWAPGPGTLLAFTSNRDGDKSEIYRLGAGDGSPLLRLTDNSFNDEAPSWPPGRITFQSDRDGNDEIYAVNAMDGLNPVRITNHPSFDLDPARSSDGARVVWVSNRTGVGVEVSDNLEIYAANADGSRVSRLTNNPASDIDPAIQPLVSAATLGSVAFSAATYTVSEGQRTLDIIVTRTGGTGAASVEIATVSGSASERNDYTTIERTLRFAAGETSRTIQLSVIDDLRNEGDETLTVSLRGAVNTTVGNPSSAIVTITDNDTAPATTNPIDTPEFFVRQQYLDFLSREPDQAGFDAWLSVLRNCSNQFNDPRCDRVTVSASFFLSSEFQIRGAVIIRSYLASFGRLPSFREFTRDLSSMGGATDEEALANRARYPDDFTQRPEFGAIYDSLTNTAYVDRMIANAGVTLPNRDQLLADLNAGTRTRAQVFNEIIDSSQFTRAAFNRAFVLSQYFGYLRRDPDAAGFQAWIDFLNANPTDFRTMVNGFVNSVEYRSRFG
ncbi:MAG: Calx-beta domain-containing protein [Pyrinomonadaceae bacterium]